MESRGRLHSAIRDGDTAQVRALLQADPSLARGLPGEPEAARALLDRGADPALRDGEGRTAPEKAEAAGGEVAAILRTPAGP